MTETPASKRELPRLEAIIEGPQRRKRARVAWLRKRRKRTVKEVE